MKTVSLGQSAEAAVAQRLTNAGFKILDTNWRTRYCEIDIIAAKEAIIYFVEVKYRRSGTQGEGLDYITSGKLRQVRFAAKLWTTQNKYEGDWRILAAAVTGRDFDQIELCEIT